MKLCTSCWKDKCECERGEYVEIDDEMVGAFLMLGKIRAIFICFFKEVSANGKSN